MKKIYRIVVNEEGLGMDAISLVTFPAVERNFLKFNKCNSYKFDTDKHIISGVVALADTPIYRYDMVDGEYWVVFEKDTIQTMVEKYAEAGLFNSVNLQHDDNKFVDGVYLIESYIINKERGICPVEFNDIPDGSWIASFKIENEELWNEIKNGKELNGFSLQGLFELEKSYFNKQINDIQILNENIMKLSKIALRNLILRFDDVDTDKGTITVDGGIAEGANVFVGEEVAENGEYVLEDGRVIVVAEGKISEIKEVEQPTEEPEPEQTEPETEEPEQTDETEPETEPETVEEPEQTEQPEEEEPVEEPTEPEVDERDARIQELEARIAELETENETLRTQLAEKDVTIAEKEEKLAMSVEKYVAEQNKKEKNNKQTFKSYLK